MRNIRRPAVILLQKSAHDVRDLVALGHCHAEVIPADHAAAADEEDLHDRNISGRSSADDIAVLAVIACDLLLLRHLLHVPDQVPQRRCVLKAKLIGRLLHLLCQTVQNIVVMPVQKRYHLLNLLPVFPL